MLKPYLDVLKRPGAARFSAAGVLARLPISTVGIGIVLAVSATYGSYALAGRVSAVNVVVGSLCAPMLSRLVDRHGQARVMGPAVVTSAIGLAVLVWAIVTTGPEWLLYVAAAVVGATMGSMGALVRARWSHVLDSPTQVHTAFSWESTLDELVFMIGPVLATALATGVTPTGGLVLAAVAGVFGGWLLLSQRSTEPPPRLGGGHHTGRLVTGPLLVLVVSFIGMGTVFGATDVSVVAFAEELGRKPLAGAVLAMFAFGSAIGGFYYGARSWPGPLWRRYGVGMVALGVGVSLFSLVNSILALALVMIGVGLSIAPTIITGNALVARLVPEGRLTEGLTWVGTSLGVGVSVGSWAGGSLIDRSGSDGGFAVVMIAGGVAVVTTLAALPALRRATARPAGMLEPGEPEPTAGSAEPTAG